MNKNIKIYFLTAGLLFVFNACQDALDTNSSLISMQDEHKINDEVEAQSALNGIGGELVSIADRYVLTGELRGDLMTASESASSELQDLNRFQVTGDNEYADKRDYYNIINNCNFLLQKLDTTLVKQNEKVLLQYYVWTKTLRAWTYFQLGLTYGKVTYFTQPILDLEASLKQYPEMQLDELVSTLIDELKPYASLFPYSWYGNGIPIQVFLGDLYLYENDYSNAASFYYNQINNLGEVVYDYANRWASTNMESLSDVTHAITYTSEVIADIPGYISMQNVYSRLVSLSYNDKPSILPSANYVQFMSGALYLYSTGSGVVASPSGDLRGMMQGSNIQMGDAYNYVSIKGGQECLIYKYYKASSAYTGTDPGNGLLTKALYIQNRIPIYRIPHLYLRFAEALNRLEKPTLAFAVLKYGLNYASVSDPVTGKVNPNELKGEEFTKFPLATFFDNNVSMAGRGRGNGIPVDTTYYVIQNLPTKQDSILWVEDRILDEMAAETPFEGNRFFDLLRISRRRPNHPAYMAEKVAAKYSDQEGMKAKLMNPSAWFLP